MAEKARKKVFVAMSGGVDSSVAAALLKKDGYDVVGVFMKTWHPEFLPCPWKEERLSAMRVAAHIGIPFLTFDFEDEYKRGVGDYFINEYRAGRTPNPDVMCNKEIKFGAFLKKARGMGADYIATGHYARKDAARLLKGVDVGKDQSYFLWVLAPAELRYALFPVGGYAKDEVRRLARKFGLPTAEKKDSQGICFLGDVDMKDFLKHYIPETEGAVLDEAGKVIGTHDGAVFYTLGERHGFHVNATNANEKPYYIVAKDIAVNTVTVSHEPEKIGGKKIFTLEQQNWISGAPEDGKRYTAQVRYRGAYLPCRAECGGERILLEEPHAAAPGQSIVVYDGDICIGGGIIA
ncbi:MAG: tRNA 2-thiouridine(34) synthase MnmA [Candidatus Lloydbacteria bacterium CG22_combo_CG10-13_8_21_14_all_47_15]|uniref:tRNA-specific 2-thiouridylase MnmA n=1 Tax=Candidatus Lloydbacteria bacterium CG22_combo_CG10-13_8_21_14_all_47_15 TaxID=1974635 RepID=A0A2H0CTL9_9BACT|nr:MAG: tRNA 2-thiouridine(34) synthase MnmA [Candidatus Lloydbacteria bacterium CG22_combo_CG10-13_8_21_14_all_47_15]